jgi:hypothetical protein
MKIFKTIDNMPENIHESEDMSYYDGIEDIPEKLLNEEVATDIAIAILRYLNYSIVKRVFTNNTLEYIRQSCLSEDEESEFYKIIKEILGNDTIQSEVLKKVINDRDVTFVDSESEADIIISLNMDEVLRQIKNYSIGRKVLLNTSLFDIFLDPSYRDYPHLGNPRFPVDNESEIYEIRSNISTGDYLNKVLGKDLLSQFNITLDLDSDLVDSVLTYRFVWIYLDKQRRILSVLDWDDHLFLGINSSGDRHIIPYEKKVKIIESLSIKLNITLDYFYNKKKSMDVLCFIKNNIVKELKSEITVIV